MKEAKKRSSKEVLESVMVYDSPDANPVLGADAGYQTFETYKVQLPLKSNMPVMMEVMENRNARPSWGIDSMLIDEELLYLEDEEADRVYHELKARSMRRREMEARENRLST